jgi:2-octaprenyl-6-methoxyphenol hydroxylase
MIDVLIIGAGMAGVTLGLGLKRAGFDVLMVDPLPFETQLAPSFDGRACAISFANFRQWRTLGAAPFLEPYAQRIEQIMVTDGRPAGAGSAPPSPVFMRFESAEISDRHGGEPLGYMLENRRIRAGLAEAAADVPVRAPDKLITYETDAGGVTATLASGEKVRTRLIVGADGRGSRVREVAGIGLHGWRYGQSAIVATVRCARDHQGVAYEHFLPSGPFAILPLTDQRASLVWVEKTADAEALKAVSDEAFLALLRRRFGDFLGEVSIEGPRFIYPLGLQHAESLTADRCVLLGDSGHGIHPIAGQGLNLGLKDAAALVDVLSEAARLGEDIGAPGVLERYARWRSVDNTAIALASDLFVRLFSNNNPLLRLARGAGVAAANRIGPARRFFMTEAGGALGDLPRLLRAG